MENIRNTHLKISRPDVVVHAVIPELGEFGLKPDLHSEFQESNQILLKSVILSCLLSLSLYIEVHTDLNLLTFDSQGKEKSGRGKWLVAFPCSLCNAHSLGKGEFFGGGDPADSFAQRTQKHVLHNEN